MGNRFFVSVPGLTKNVHINRRIGFAANSPLCWSVAKKFFSIYDEWSTLHFL